MANRDDDRRHGGDHGRDRWRPDEGGASGARSSEQRSFDGRGGRGEGEREPWRRDRYGARYDQDRTGYGSGYDSQGGGYGRGAEVGPGQTYGMEGGRDHRADRGREDGRSDGQGDTRSRWRDEGGPYGDLELNPRDRGVRDFGPPADYAYHPQAGHEFDPDYTRWRDQQLEAHDRDYRDWRAHQHRQYDDDYRRFRSERRESFGRNFHEWRAQRNLSGGMTDTHIEPGRTDTAGKTAHAGGLYPDQDRPSGALEPPGAMTPSPTLGQAGGGMHAPAGGAAARSEASGSGPGFGAASPLVQAASDGETRPHGEDAGRPDDAARKP